MLPKKQRLPVKLTTRFFWIFMAIAVAPLLLAVGSKSFQGGLSIYVFTFFACAIILGTLAMVLLISKRIIRPINNMVEAVKMFLKNEHRLEKTIPQDGWPEINSLAGVLNRTMLELQAFRAFQFNLMLEEKNKAQALADTIPDGALLLDDRNQLIYANLPALRLLGIPRLLPELVFPQIITVEVFLKEFTSILAMEEKLLVRDVELPLPQIAAEAELKCRSYRIIANQFSLATLRKPGRVILIRDVTSEKELEKAKEDFFHMITHDMRAPLATIQGYAEMLKRKYGSAPDTEKYFTNILFSSRKLRGMIDDILNVTKLERGTMQLLLEKQSASGLLAGVRDNNAPAANSKQLQLEVAPDALPLEFYGDAQLLERVLTNLVGNSIKFTPPGGTITLGVSDAGDALTFYVQDTGPGIPEDKRQTIFEKYSQMEEHKSQGFGLGLAMCRMTVDLHKGKIWVESEVGKGSKFIFTVSKSLKV